MVTKKQFIEKIYIGKTNTKNPNEITKILIQYQDGEYQCYKNTQGNLNHILYLKLKQLQKQNPKQKLGAQQVIFFTNQDKELNQYVDDTIEKINNLNLITKYETMAVYFAFIAYSFFDIACDCKTQFFSLIQSLENWILNWKTYGYMYIVVQLSFMISSVFSGTCCFYALSHIKKNKSFFNEHKSLKRLKLYLNYLLLTVNIGFNITNLNINYEQWKRLPYAITLEEKKEEQKKILCSLENPFLDKNLDTNNQEKVDIVMDAFQKNSLLNNQQQRIYAALKKYLQENPYCDYEELYEVFSSLLLADDPLRNTTKGEIVTNGTSDLDSRIITIYVDEKDKHFEEILSHEVIHFTGYLENMMLNEGMTTLIDAEYRNNGIIENAYHEHVQMTKIFCELITPEKMLEAYSKKDMSIIEEEMLKICDSHEVYENLMNKMQQYAVDFSIGVDDDFKEKYQSISLQFYKLLSPYLDSDCISDSKKEFIVMSIFQLTQECDNVNYFHKENNINKEKQPYMLTR